MKKPVSLVLLLLLCLSGANPVLAQTAAKTVSSANPQMTPASGLLDGTPIRFRLNRTITSKEAKTGESLDFEVLDDIKVGDLIVIPRESSAMATVTNAKPAGRLGKGGKLDVNIDYVRLVSGEKVPLRAAKESKGGNRTGAMTGAMVATGILFFPAAPLFLFMKGKNITVAKGTEVTAYVNGDFPIDRAKFGPRAAAVSALASDTTGVTIKSIPEGAEIEVDGQFMGSTPSSLQLKKGEHKIVVKKSGFATWERTITVTSGSAVTVDASLEKNP